MGSSTTTRFFLLLSTTPTPLFLRRCPSLLRRLPLSRSPRSVFPAPLRLISSSFSSSSQFHTQPRSPISSFWPEWSQLLDSLSSAGYFPSEQEENPSISDQLAAVSSPLSHDFLKSASACFAFSRARSHVLWMLPRRDIEVVVQHGVPFLFKDCDESARRMKNFLAGNDRNSEGAEVAVDLMKYLLSYVNGVDSSDGNNVGNAELVEPSVRNLLREMCHLSYFNDNSQRSNIEMKRGDWICPRCQFMNFARNVKCRECEEPRPRKQLTGREWECPQCNFLNFGRNVVCLRCDCKRPGDSLVGLTNSGSGFGCEDGNNASKAGADSISAANEEKTQRWFRKLSELHSSSTGVNSDIVDGNFLEKMPLRKGVNKRVVAFEQANNPKYVPFVPFPPGYFARKDDQQQDNKATGETSISEIPGRFTDTTLGVSHKPNAPVTENQQLGTTHEPRSGNSTQNVIDPPHGGSNSRRERYSSFDTTSEMLYPEGDSQQNLSAHQRGGPDSDSSGYPGKQNSNETGNFSSPQPSVKPSIAANWTGKSLEGSQVKEPDPLDMSEEAKAERWFRRVAQIKDISELSQIPDEDFPSIMPMRKGVNRFVVSKRKTPLERRLTSTHYRRNLPVVSSDPVKENDNS